MDWASAEWKQALSPLAVQKVNALEEKIEKLQKERQQKQLQCECLELALGKEKQKVEKEKQHTIEVQRELQSLADVCKDLENKQQKLQNEILGRDSRIGSLETLLSHSKKENCRLQQLETDLKDLRCVRENSLIEREQKLQKRLSLERSIIQEQKSNISDSISEETLRVKHLSGKENQNIFNGNEEIDHASGQKIMELETIIKELRSKLSLISRNEENKDSSNLQFKTPGKTTVESVTDSPAVHAETPNVWDGFGSTPAKGNKERVLRHHSDSSVLDSGNEKIMSLQTRLKQLGQELDCQRHNFEASRNAIEQKFKEKESTLKSDLKYQVQVNAELDKELKDVKNRYHQEITQATKKLDLLTLQLKKSEQAKETLERDIKSMELKLNANESNLRAKEEELQRLKNLCDSTQQSSQSKIHELEIKCRGLLDENSSLNGSISSIQLQLDGSNNLVKEKENRLLDAQKESDNYSVLNKNLQVKLQELECILATQQIKLQDSLLNQTSLAEKLEFLEQEKKELSDSLISEMTSNHSLESCIGEQKQKNLLLNEELTKKSLDINELKEQMMILNKEYQIKIEELSKVSPLKKCRQLLKFNSRNFY